jgi:hypothetical protein
MTETTQTQPAQTTSTPTPKLNINREHAAIHLAILGDRTNYIVTAKNHNTNKVRNKALTKAEILTFAEDMNNQGFCVWISLNPKEDDGNIYVTALADFWLDIDARPKGIDDRAATQQEIDEAYDRAIKLKEYIEKTYGAVGFIAFSGNGYHLHFPLPHTEFTPEQRALIGTSETDTVTNAKVRNFAKQTATNIGKTIDNTYDINRKTALIGSFNLKILNQPIQTNWLEDFLPETLDGTLKSVDYARNQNQKLLEAILNTSIEQQQPTMYRDITKPHQQLDKILEEDEKLRDYYYGNFGKYQGDDDRSRAEMWVLCCLMGRHGFSKAETYQAMQNCKIDKWQEEPESYRKLIIENAHKHVMENPTPATDELDEETTSKLEALALNPNNEQRFLDDIHRKVKKDDVAVFDTFHIGLSTYMKPNNLIHKSPSGAGKTYSTTETMDYFPQEDLITIGTQSPKVLSHQQGELMTIDANGKEVSFSYDETPEKPKNQDYKGKPEDYKAALEDYKRQHREYEQKIKNHYTLIRLAGKAMVFLDTISRETFEMYKTLLSHDKPKISHEYVDDKGNVHRTVLEGWPSATFCTADPRILSPEFLTRTFSDYLQTDQGKIAAAQEVIDNTTSDPWEYEDDTDEKKLIKLYIREIRNTIKQFNIKSVQPFPNLRNIIAFSNTIVRDMRDYSHFSQLFPTYTMFKLFQRPIITINGEHRLVVTIDDVLDALEQFHKIEETTRSGTDKTILDFYYDAIATIDTEKGATVTEIQKKSKVKSAQTIRDRLRILEQAGYVNIEEGLQKDQRRWTVFPIKVKVDETTTDNQTDVDLRFKLKKDAESWIETSSSKYPSIQIQKIDFRTKQLIYISLDEFKTLIGIDQEKKLIGIDQDFNLLVSNEENSSISKNTLKSTSDNQTVVVPPNNQSPLDFNIIAYCVPLKKEELHPDQVCAVCQEKKPLTYTYRTYDSKDGYVCFECGDKIRCHIDQRD